MTQKEINELRARVYSISSSMFPLDAFLNDIEQIKNQNYDKEGAYNDLKLITDAIYELKDKLKEKEQDYTLEEVKKEWEDLGYGWLKRKDVIIIKNLNITFRIDLTRKTYITNCTDILHFESVTFQEHQLLTKTFKVLEKEKK